MSTIWKLVTIPFYIAFYFVLAIGSYLITIITLLHYIFPAIIMHEFGHFFAAGAVGMKVDAFAFGVGWNLLEHVSSSGVHWQLNLIPVAGYNSISPQSMAAATPWQRLFLDSAGLLVNLVSGMVCLGIAEACRRRYIANRLTRTIAFFGLIHLSLLVFNALPGWGLDGGHMLNDAISLFVPFESIDGWAFETLRFAVFMGLYALMNHLLVKSAIFKRYATA